MVNFEVLEKKMKAKGHTQMSLERAANISNGVVGKWRTVNPNVDTLQKVAAVLECTVDDLLIKEKR
jgi:transcriptional regulator with XRE-family HTH domain